MTFKSGKSGNPRGKKPGTKNKRLELFRSSDEQLQRKVLEMALGGDLGAMKIIADRLWPRLRAQAVPVNVQTESSDLASQGSAIVAAVLNGKLPPDTAKDLLSALSDQARLIEFSEIESRLQVLENHKDAPPWKACDSVKYLTAEKLPIRGNRRRRNK